MPNSQTARRPPTLWQNVGRHLWLGVSGKQDVAVIEKDGRYAAIDATGHVKGIFPTLLRAQVALTSSDPD